MHVRVWLCKVASAVSLALVCGCAVDEFSPTNDYSKKKEAAPIPRGPAPAGKPGEPPPAPANQGKADPDAPKEFTTTESGLKYKILRKSNGKKPTPADMVSAHYRGWLDDGQEFDSSYKRGKPSDFPLSRVVKGWTEGLQYVGEGGMIELEIPGKLGYPDGRPGIPPGATLHFIVELVKVKEPRQ